MILTRYVLRSGNAYVKPRGFGEFQLDSIEHATQFKTEEEAQKVLNTLKLGNLCVTIVKRTIVEDEELPDDCDKTPYVDKPLYARYSVTNHFEGLLNKYLNR